MVVFDVRTGETIIGMQAALSELSNGGLVGIPTETVYGLAADATSDAAVKKIYEAKNRPHSNPLIIHVSDLFMAQLEGCFGAHALKLAEKFWPGPLTLVVPRAHTSTVCMSATAGSSNIALRIPDNFVAMSLIQRLGRPLAAPSANLSGYITSTSAADVVSDLGDRVQVILDYGPSRIGIESTIVYCVDDSVQILRFGCITVADIRRVLGFASSNVLIRCCNLSFDSDVELAPGMQLSHYSPRAALKLNAVSCTSSDAMLDFAAQCKPMVNVAYRYMDLSPLGDLREASVNLFRYMRELDVCGLNSIAVATIPTGDFGDAINDRLKRAAVS